MDNDLTDPTKEMPSNVYMIEDHEWGDIEDVMAVVSAENAISAARVQPMYENLPLPGTSTQEPRSVLALPAPSTPQPMDTTEPPVMTVAIPTDMSVVSTQTVTTTANNSQVPQVHSQIGRLLALALRNEVGTSTTSTTASGTELVPSNPTSRTKYPYRRRQTVEVC